MADVEKQLAFAAVDGEAPLQHLPISVGIPKTDKMTNFAVGLSRLSETFWWTLGHEK